MMYNNNVDWAQLAQQWIQMRDLSPQPMPEAPPPPAISNNPDHQKPFVEQGEADMEVVKDDEDFNERSSFDNISNTQNTHLQQKQITSPLLQQNDIPFVTALPEEWNPWPARVALPPPVLHIPTTDSTNFSTTNNPMIPAMKLPTQTSVQNARELVTTSSDISQMDPRKRKILPAWIREGLEKMEREKQKQKKQESQEKDIIPKTSVKEIVTTNQKSILPESDCSGNEDDSDDCAGESDYSNLLEDSKEGVEPANKILQTLEQKSGKSYEQKLSELMVVVRRTLTELLLEVTNDEIANICQEAIKYQKTKGLAAYDDSSSEKSSLSSDEDSDSSKKSDNTEKTESEEEIKAKIKAAKRAFSQTCVEIEERIAQSELREEKKLKDYAEREINEKRKNEESADKKCKAYTICDNPKSAGKSLEKDFGETPDTKFHQSNGKRQKERMTRFSDNKDSRKVISNYLPTQASNKAVEVTDKKRSTNLHSPPSSSIVNHSKTINAITNQSNISKIGDTLTKSTVENVTENIGKNVLPLTASLRKRRKSSRDTSSTSSSSSQDSYKRRDRYKSYSKNSSRSSSSHKSSTSRRKTSYRDHNKYSRKKDSTILNEYDKSRYESKYSSRRNRGSHDRSRSDSRSSRSRSRSSYSSNLRKC